MTRTPEIDVLGPFQARWSDGEAIRIGSKKAQALLAYLAVERNRSHTRESLASMLWGHTGEERARHNLRQALGFIKAACDCLLLSDRNCVQFNAQGCSCDVASFETLASSDDSEQLGQCLALYRGELLEGLNPREPDYSDWLMMARTRLRQLACAAAARLGGFLLDQDRDHQAMEVYTRMLGIDSANELAHRNLMILLDRNGRRSEALRQYQLCSEAMQRELGAQPATETREIAQRLRGDEPAVTDHEPTSEQAPKASPVTSQPSVAVMPFDNLAGPDDAYFADGMTEDLVTALSCFRSLVVIARGSSFVFRDSDLGDSEIADRLGADYLVRGSVRRSGNRVRINVHLLAADSGASVWSHRYDREMEDVFLLQDEITSTLVSTLAGRVEATQLRQARRAPPERLDAHDLLLRGRDHHHQYTQDDCKTCIELFEQAIEQDPAYAPAHAWLACGLGQAMVFGLDDLAKLLNQSQQAAERGLALDDNDSECHRVLAQIYLERGDLDRAMQHQQRAMSLNPNDDRIVNAMGELLVYTGEYEQAEEWIRRSLTLNPYHPQRYWTHLARSLFHQSKFSQALEALQRIDHPRKDDCCYTVAVLQQLGENDKCKEAWKQLKESFPGFEPCDFISSLPLRDERGKEALVAAISASH